MHELERRVIGKVMRRLIPFLILCYFVAYLDRVNVGFAKLHMNQALGFNEAAFGLVVVLVLVIRSEVGGLGRAVEVGVRHPEGARVDSRHR